jgi:hypothetical protein
VCEVLSPDGKLALVVVLGFCWSEREGDASVTLAARGIEMKSQKEKRRVICVF